MTSELSFLIDLLLNHRLPKATKETVADRIKEVEADRAPMLAMAAARPIAPTPAMPIPPALAGQAPSTIAALQRHPDLLTQMQAAQVMDPPLHQKQQTEAANAEPQPVAIVAQTPATAAALASRQQAIAEAISGKVDKVNGRPKKW